MKRNTWLYDRKGKIETVVLAFATLLGLILVANGVCLYRYLAHGDTTPLYAAGAFDAAFIITATATTTLLYFLHHTPRRNRGDSA